MPLYEHVFLARQDLAQAQVDALAENATKIITDNGGKVVKTETWGLRSLAYRIAKNRKAHYVALDLDAPAAAIAELERQSNINEDVIRFLTIRVDEHEKGPSAMMRRGDKERSRRRATVAIAATAPSSAPAKRRSNNGPRILPPPQVVPFLGQGRAEDRLQGRAPAPGLHLRARQDRARRASPPSPPRSSASWRGRSSAPATSACFPTS